MITDLTDLCKSIRTNNLQVKNLLQDEASITSKSRGNLYKCKKVAQIHWSIVVIRYFERKITIRGNSKMYKSQKYKFGS